MFIASFNMHNCDTKIQLFLLSPTDRSGRVGCWPPLNFLTIKWEGRAAQEGGSDPPPGKSHLALTSTNIIRIDLRRETTLRPKLRYSDPNPKWTKSSGPSNNHQQNVGDLALQKFIWPADQWEGTARNIVVISTCDRRTVPQRSLQWEPKATTVKLHVLCMWCIN